VQGQGFSQIVGYYEGWSPNRPCNKFFPEQIPRGVYTHLNFAFATIDPVTFEVKLASPFDDDLLRRLVNLKGADPSLKVFIAIGGWTFNDPGPTATTFSDIAGSTANTLLFAKSLVRFMAAYNLDGVDIDWEYPEAPDRSGRPQDYANFPSFLSKLKTAFLVMGRHVEISIIIPASFWYLRHFDLIAMQKSVDFFNLMSYDFHGTRDIGNRWVGPYLNSHTNLTEVKDALDLLWRNDIKPDKVVLGMAFYGRSFTVADPACTSPGCEYGSGSPKQPCSGEVSVVLNSEIEDIRKRTGAVPVLDSNAAVKMLVWDTNQWLTYDDQETFALRADFARSQCLGGVMVWAVSHDTKDAKYSKALAVAANKKFQALQMNSDGTETIKEEHPQCKWTGCLERTFVI
jgi:GH18 family chitinase